MKRKDKNKKIPECKELSHLPPKPQLPSPFGATAADFDVAQAFRNIAALIEHNNARIDVIGEQYSDIKKTLDSHSEKLDSHAEMIGSVMEKQDATQETLDNHTEMLTSIGTFMKNNLGYSGFMISA